jgi:hypothetical protein
MWSILSNHSALAERRQHFVGAVEIGHFDIRCPDPFRIVRIGAHGWSNIELLREANGCEVMRRVADFGVEHLDDVQLTRADKSLQHRLSESSAFGIERVRRIHKAALCFDAVDHLRNREDIRNPLRQEQADNLPRRSADFFANDYPDSQFALKGLRRLNGVVISDAHHVEVHRFDALGNFFQRRARIARGGCVQMTVKAYPSSSGRRRRPNRI